MKASYTAAFMLTFLAFTTASLGDSKTQTVSYTHEDTALEGYLVLPEGDPRGAVLVVHEWWGLNDYAKRRADMLADLGYIAFAIDMYGKGKVTEDPAQAGRWAGEVTRDRRFYRDRAMAGLNALKASGYLPENTPIAAIGYCFGGTTVMELAYAGADLAGVVSFHGNPKPPLPDDVIRASILICHGDADPLVTDDTLKATTSALDDKGVDWMLIRYAGAKHAFSNPKADSYGMPPVGYDARADRRSWQHMKAFLDEVLGSDQ